MRTIKTFLLVALAVIAASCGQPRNRAIENPSIVGGNTSDLDIRKVELTDSNTVLSFHVVFRPGWWIKISPESYIETEGQRFPLVSADGIVPGEEFIMPESGEADFKLTFGAIPASAKDLTFSEGDGWTLYGVDLTGKAGRYDIHPDLPGDVRKAGEGEICAGPVMETGNTTINFHVLGFKSSYDKEYSLYSIGISGLEEEAKITVDDNGEASITLPIYGTSEISLKTASGFLPSLYVAPGETVEVYFDPRYIGDKYVMKGRESGSTVKRTYLFDNGKYAALNRAIGSSDYDLTLQAFDADFADWQMTAGEFTDKVLSTYKELSDSIAASDADAGLTGFLMAKLQSEALTAMAEARMILGNDFYRKHPAFDGNARDSIKASFTDEDYSRIIDLIDVDDPMLLVGGLSNFRMACSELGQLATKGRLPGELKLYGEAFEKANAAELTAADIDALKKLSTTFYVKAVTARQAEMSKKLEALSDLVSEIPDTDDDKLFDAIVAPHKGKVVLVDLWNTWCGPCRAALAANEPLKSGELADEDIVWIYIADTSSNASTYIDMIPGIKGIHYRVNEEQIRAIRDRFNVDGIPYYILVDRKGNAVGHPDFRDHSKLKEGINAALAEK